MKTIRNLILFAAALLALPLFTQASTGTAKPGQTASFTLTTLSGDLPMTYQWKKDGVNLTVSGSTGTITTLPTTGVSVATLTLITLAKTDAGSYVCEIANAYGSTASDTAVLAVGNPPAGAVTGLKTQ